MKSQHAKAMLVSLIVWGLGCLEGRAQEINSKITSIFIYNFAKQIEWPPQAANGEFVIGVLGRSPVLEELRAAARTVKIRNQSVVIKQLANRDAPEMTTCHIVFVTDKESNALKDIGNRLQAASVLVISEGEGMTRKGSMIALFLNEEEDRVKFELNKPLLEKHGLKAAATLVSLAAAN